MTTSRAIRKSILQRPFRSESSNSSWCSYDDLEDNDMDDRVYDFDITKYKDGTYRFLSASAIDRIRYVGRFLHHGTETTRMTKVNTVQFDWPASTVEVCVSKTTSVAIRLKGDGNYFNVFVNGSFQSILRAGRHASCCNVIQDLDPHQQYIITISKRTEPQRRGAFSIFKVCTLYGFIIEQHGEFLPCLPPKQRSIEFIGDEDTCAFGNERTKPVHQQTHWHHPQSVLRASFGWKGRMVNVYNGYACILARMFQADAHVVAWSGKGVHSNAADWGPNMLSLWKRTIACKEGDGEMTNWTPDVVVINLGKNDLSPPSSSEVDIVAAYALLLAEVRSYRPNADIFAAVCDEECISSEYTSRERRQLSLQLQEIIKVAMSKVNKYDSKMHYLLLHVVGGLERNDYGPSMHYTVSGHVKIAQALVNAIALKTGWSVVNKPMTMPYPQEKRQIHLPDEERKCVIS